MLDSAAIRELKELKKWKTFNSEKYNKSCIPRKMQYSTYFDSCVKAQINLFTNLRQLFIIEDNESKYMVQFDP
uniref:Uncharacterized protein n=1 Tax=Romanomermis culicivorax TaxID=13658 RepID=A0A915KFZ3_ROMCU